MTIPADQIAGLVSAWFWPFFRIAAVVTASPVFGNRVVPARVKLGIALALSMVIVPLLPQSPYTQLVDPMSITGVIVTAREVVIGLAFGFALRLALLAMELTGQFVAHLMGLGFASLVDPQSGIDVPVLSQFYIILATLVFLGIDGHLLIVATLVESFTVIPVGLPRLNLTALWEMTGGAGWVFAAALKLALPAIVTLLVVNIAFGVISRAAPQLHIIVIGFPLTLIFGFIIIWLSYSTMVDEFPSVFSQAFDGASRVLGGLR